MVFSTALLVLLDYSDINNSRLSLMRRILGYNHCHAKFTPISRLIHSPVRFRRFQWRREFWQWRFLWNIKPFFFKVTTLKRYASHTRCRVMAFIVMHYSNTDKHSIYIFGVNLNQENNNSGLSPLQSFDISLFDHPQKKIHRCGMDNLYMSQNCVCFGFNNDKQVVFVYFTYKGNLGLPANVLQEENIMFIRTQSVWYNKGRSHTRRTIRN